MNADDSVKNLQNQTSQLVGTDKFHLGIIGMSFAWIKMRRIKNFAFRIILINKRVMGE